MRPNTGKPIKRTRTFRQHYADRVGGDELLAEVVNRRVGLFAQDRSNSKLKDHALSWDMQGLRAFSITKEIRVVYEETKTAFIFRDIGTHRQVYHRP